MLINTINRYVALFFMVIAAILTLQGCAAKWQDLADKGKVHIETVSSSHGHVSKVSVVDGESGIRVSGEVHGTFHERGYIRGHVDIEIISPYGVMLGNEIFAYHNRGGKSRMTPFSIDIPVEVPEGSTIRVTHHATFISDHN